MEIIDDNKNHYNQKTRLGHPTNTPYDMSSQADRLKSKLLVDKFVILYDHYLLNHGPYPKQNVPYHDHVSSYLHQHLPWFPLFQQSFVFHQPQPEPAIYSKEKKKMKKKERDKSICNLSNVRKQINT